MDRTRFAGPVALAVSVLAACGGAADEASRISQEDAASTGRLVIVGGALDEENADVWGAVLAARDGTGEVCVIPTASGVPERSMESARETLDRHGGPGTAVGVAITDGDVAMADDPAIAALLRGCSGYWFTGGSQSRIVDTFLPGGSSTAAYEAVRERFEEGAVIAGSSAGAAMMSTLMIAGGSSESAVTSGLRVESEGEGVRIVEGLGFFDGGVLDQHFMARGRIGRLLVTVLEHPEISVGFGIDENTAMVVDGDRATVVGESGVVVVDGRSARSATDDGARALRVTLVGSGDRVDLGTLDVTTGSGKTPLQPAEAGIPSSGLFERWTFLHVLVGLAGSSETGVTYDLAGADLRLAEGVGFRAVAVSGGDGPEGTPRGFSAGPYEVTLAPTR